MSTLKTHNLQSPDSGSVNIAMAPNAGMVVAGLSTYSNQINVGSNIQLGTAGVVTATSFSGSGANLTGITQTTINSNTNNYLITGTGTANTLQGEANLTFDGTYLNIGTTDNSPLAVGGISGALSTSARANISLKTGATDGAANTGSGLLFFNHSGGGQFFGGSLQVLKENGSTGNTASLMRFCTRPNGGSVTEALRIDSSGRLRVASTTESADGAFDDVIVGNHSGNRGISILSGATSQGALGFAKSGTLADGYVAYNHNSTATDSSMVIKSSGIVKFNAGSVERLRITSGGMVGIAHHVEGQIGKELTIRPANNGGIRYVRPGETSGSPNIHLDLTTTTSGSAFPTGEAYTVKYKTYNCDQIFETYEGGGTGGNISLRTRSSSVESVRINKNGIVTVPYQPAFRNYTTSDGNGNGTVANIWNTGAEDKRKFDNNDDFNTTNGRFTAPVDGVYQISVAYDENNTSTTIDIHINGGGGALDLYSTEPHTASGWNSHFTGSITKLSSGDYVTINLRNTSGAYPFHQGNGRWGHFSVYLIG